MAANNSAIMAVLSPKLDHHFFVILLLLTDELKKLVTEGDAVIATNSFTSPKAERKGKHLWLMEALAVSGTANPSSSRTTLQEYLLISAQVSRS
ncbi:hypothetical protein PS1_007669 [Malus domestica]